MICGIALTAKVSWLHLFIDDHVQKVCQRTRVDHYAPQKPDGVVMAAIY